MVVEVEKGNVRGWTSIERRRPSLFFAFFLSSFLLTLIDLLLRGAREAEGEEFVAAADELAPRLARPRAHKRPSETLDGASGLLREADAASLRRLGHAPRGAAVPLAAAAGAIAFIVSLTQP